jgi:hypothetical protein
MGSQIQSHPSEAVTFFDKVITQGHEKEITGERAEAWEVV